MTAPSTAKLRGIVPPVPTPLRRDGSIDAGGFRAIADHLVRGGIDAAFILGSTGESASLSLTRRMEAIDHATAGFGARVPVIAGIGDCCMEQSLELAHHAAARGIAAVVLNAPYYYEITGSEMCRYLDKILPLLPLPVFLYNMPWLTGHALDDHTLNHAMTFPGLAGFKDSSGDLAYLGRLLATVSARPELAVLVGNDFLFLEALKLGAHGAVAGGSNLYPKLFIKLLNAYHQGDTASAEALQREISARGERIFKTTGTPCSTFASIKGGLAALGLCEPTMAPPLQACTAEQVARLASLLAPACAA
jgi:dihydrodipicolinate synthase/N-acetylneuraminate lyase